MASDLRDLLGAGVRGLRRLLADEPAAAPARESRGAEPATSGPTAPVAPSRAERRGGEPLRGVLFLSHTDPTVSVSGVDRFLHGEFAWLEAQDRSWSVFSPEQGVLPRRYACCAAGGRVTGRPGASLLTAVDRALDEGAFDAVVVHHLFGFEPTFAHELLERVRGLPIQLHLHDIYLLNLDGLARDFSWLPRQFGWEPEAFAAVAEEMNAVVAEWLRASRLVVLPSEDLAARLGPQLEARGVSAGSLRVQEPLKFSPYRPRERVRHAKPRLAFLGHAMETKGWESWRRLRADPAVREAFDLFHLGADGDGESGGVREVAYTIAGGNPYAPVAALHDHEIDLVLLWSTVPESSSYTMWEAHAAGVPVLTGAGSGNIAARVGAGAVAGRVFEDEAGLLEFLRDKDAVEALLGAQGEAGLLRMEHRPAIPLIFTETAAPGSRA